MPKSQLLSPLGQEGQEGSSLPQHRALVPQTKPCFCKVNTIISSIIILLFKGIFLFKKPNTNQNGSLCTV